MLDLIRTLLVATGVFLTLIMFSSGLDQRPIEESVNAPTYKLK